MTNDAEPTQRRSGPDSDRVALIALYRSTSGTGWARSDGWLSDVPIGSWYGVTTTADGRVSELDLSGNRLSGELPPELGDLSALTVLGLHENELRGPIPSAIGRLTALRELYLGGNALSGELPSALGRLTALRELHLGGNALTGVLPVWLGDLQELRELGLDRNQFSGSIPTELGKLTRLTRLYLDRNQLSGAIPSALVELTSLTRLYLGRNELTGVVPAWLGELTELTRLGLEHNRLSGVMPPPMRKLTNLTRLYLGENQIGGEIPYWIGELTELSRLGLERNHIEGGIPRAVCTLSKLTRLGLGDNRLTGDVPPGLAELGQLEYLSLEGNQDLHDGRADLFNLNATGNAEGEIVRIVAPSEEWRPEASGEGDVYGAFARTHAPAVSHASTEEYSAAYRDPFDRRFDTATFHLFSVAPIELYDEDIASHVRMVFLGRDEWEETASLPFDPEILGDLDMTPKAAFEGREAWIGGERAQVFAVFIRTSVCLVIHGRPTLEMAHDDIGTYKRITWAIKLSGGVPVWVRELFPYNPRGALYRAVWIWIYQRYVWRQWVPSGIVGHGTSKTGGTARDVAVERERAIESLLGDVFPGDQRVDLIKSDQVRIFTFSALEIGPRDNGQVVSGADVESTSVWREHFPTTTHALDILSAVDDDVPLSESAIKGFDKGVYGELHRIHHSLRALMQSEELTRPAESLREGRFQEIAGELVNALSPFDLQRVRAGLIRHSLLKGRQQPVESDWLDVQDGDEHVLLLADPDSVTLATASQRHINEIVGMEVALQVAWNSFARAAGRVLRAHDERDRTGAGDGRAASDEEDTLLDFLSDQLLRVTRWRAQLSGWRRVAFERLRQTSGLDENIDAFYRASEESVRRSEVLREKQRADFEKQQALEDEARALRERRFQEARAEREKRFQAAIGIAAVALAAVVLGEIAISIEAAQEEARAAPVARTAAWIVGIGAVVIAWIIAKSFSGMPRLPRMAGRIWEGTWESPVALLLVGAMAFGLSRAVGWPHLAGLLVGVVLGIWAFANLAVLATKLLRRASAAVLGSREG